MLARKFVLLVLLPLLVLVVGAEVAVYVVTAESLRTQADHGLEASAAALNTAITARLDGVLDDAEILADDRLLEEYFTSLRIGRTLIADEQLAQLEESYVRVAGLKPTCKAFRLYRRDGRAAINVVDGERSYDLVDGSGASWFRAALVATDATPHISRVLPGNDAEPTRMVIWRPIRDHAGVDDTEESGGVIGVIAIEVVVADLVSDLLPPARAGADGYAYVVELSGRVAATDPPGAVRRDVSARESTRLLREGRAGVLSASDDGGESLRVAFVPQAASDLGLVIAVPHATIFAPVDGMRNTIIVLTATGFLTVLLVGLALIRRSVEPLLLLTDGAGRVARGELDLKLDVQTDDEVGELAASFNRMTHSLRTTRGELTAAVRAEERRTSEVGKAYTRLKETQRDLAQAEKMSLLGQLAGGIAHDFNNLLGGILGSADLLRRGNGRPEDRVRNIELIHATAQRAADLVRQLMEFARPGPTQRVTLDVDALVRESIRVFQLTVEPGIRVETRLRAGDACIEGDTAALESAILNLSNNARDALTGDGTITFTTAVTEIDEDTGQGLVPHIAPGAYVEIGVADTGIGMPPDVIARVFEPFFTTKEIGKGTGLGLAAVFGTVRGHGGSINVYSEPGRGTQFKLYLPLAKGSVTERSPDSDDVIRGSGRVLLVDDEPVIREVARHMLESIGYDVIVANDGEHALALYHEHGDSIDLVLTDFVMPGMNGIELLAALRQVNPHVALVIASGFRLDASEADLRHDGARGFLSKPFVVAELARVVAAALHPEQSADATDAHGAADDELPTEPPQRGQGDVPVGAAPIRVLIVDDSPLNREVMAALAREIGADAIVVGDGATAVRRIAGSTFDVVLMDVGLDGMSGPEATRAIRSAGHKLPIVAVTGDTGSEQRDRCLAAGMDDVSAKPASIEEMESILKRFGRRPPPTPAAAAEKAPWGPAGLQQLLATTFLEEAPRLLEDLRQAVKSADAEALHRAAHTLHGSLRHFDAADASDLSDRLQAKPPPPDANRLAEALVAACERLMDQLLLEPLHSSSRRES